MSNEKKLFFIVFGIVLFAFGLGWAMNLSFNPQTFQIGYTVYSQTGEKLRGFIPERANSEPTCNDGCPASAQEFVSQCQTQNHKAFRGSCCQSLCSGNIAQATGGTTL